MQSLTNGSAFLHPSTYVKNTRSYPLATERVPGTGNVTWWGFFRRGEQIHLEVAALDGTAHARILDTFRKPLSARIAAGEPADLSVCVPHDGIIYFEVDGHAGQPIEFTLDVVEQREEVRERREVAAKRAGMLARFSSWATA